MGALDPVGGKMTGDLFKLLGKGGKLLLYGVLSYPEPITLDAMQLINSGATIGRFLCYDWVERVRAACCLHVLVSAACCLHVPHCVVRQAACASKLVSPAAG